MIADELETCVIAAQLSAFLTIPFHLASWHNRVVNGFNSGVTHHENTGLQARFFNALSLESAQRRVAVMTPSSAWCPPGDHLRLNQDSNIDVSTAARRGPKRAHTDSS